MMHFVTRKTEAVEARQAGISEPESEPIELRLDEVEQRVTKVEGRVDKLLAAYRAADKVLGK